MTVRRANLDRDEDRRSEGRAASWPVASGDAVLLFDNTLPFAVMRLSRAGGHLRVDYVSESCQSVWGLSRAEIGDDFGKLWERVHPEDTARVKAILAWAEDTASEWSATFRIRRDDSEDRWAVARGLPRDDIAPGTWNVTVTDISAQIAAFSALRESESKLRALAESIPGAAFHARTGPDGRDVVSFMSAACEDIWELTADQIRNDTSLVWRQIHPQDMAGVKATLQHASATLAPWFHRWRILTPSGRQKWIEGRGRAERRPDGTVIWNGLIVDVSEQRRQERELRRLAEHDDLTGLANRVVLRRRIGDEIAIRETGGGLGALLLMDIDGFNEINEMAGHDAGDAYLRAFAERLVGLASPGELAARLDGDEFALVLPAIETEEELKARMARMAARLAEAVAPENRSRACGVSMGAALFPRDGTTADAVLKHANLALSEARGRGRNARVVYSPEMTLSRDRRSILAGSLRADIARDNMQIAFQPIVDVGSGRHCGFEALARWTLEGRPISPAEFIPLAEETNLSVPLGALLLRKALARAAELRAMGHDPGIISVNVSAGQIRDPDFLMIVEDLIGEFAHPPGALEIEVTETVILGRWGEQISTTLRRLRRLGIRVALDDFGTGYASLLHLKQIRVDRLKIDRSFIQNVDGDVDDAIIVKAILGLGEALGLEVVAEGVETEAQLEFLRDHGCPLAQGYLFGRPTLDPDELRAYLAAAPRG